MKQFCPKCGKWYDVSGNVCPICRSQLLVPNNNNSQTQNTQQENKNTQYQQKQNPTPIPKEINKKRSRGDIMKVFGIIIFLTFICLFFISIDSSYLSVVFTILFFVGTLFGLVLLAFGIRFSREYSAYIKEHYGAYNLSLIADNPSVECPYCHSHKVAKIDTVNRAVSTLAVGIASSKLGKQWHCHNCNSDF